MLRTTVLLICINLIPLAADAQEIARLGPAFLGGSGTTSGGTTGTTCGDATHDSGGNPITLCEDMEGSVDCDAGAGTQIFCRNGFTVIGPPTFNTTGIEDTYSVATDSTSATQVFYKTVSDANAYYVFAKIKVVAWPTAGVKTFLYINAGGIGKLEVQMTTAGKVLVKHGTITSTATTDAMAEGSTYYLWAGYAKESVDGALDGAGYVGFSTDTTKPGVGNKYSATAVGNSEAQVNRIIWGHAATAEISFVWDRIRVNTSDFGSDPS